MAIIVQKFGGTSVGDIDRIKNVASIIQAERDKGNQVIAIVSAMAGVTDQLVGYVGNVSSMQTVSEKQEYDSILSAGEKISSGLLALSLRSRGVKARSWQGWQIPIVTDDAFTKGKIKHIRTENLFKAIANDEVPVIAGFQGIHNDRVITFGRGGSDTTATAIAAAVNADRCDIYTDVDGVYTTDPRIVSKARKVDNITYEEMLEMAASGAKVLHPRAVEVAIKYGVKVQVLSSFSNKPGTFLIKEEEAVEQQAVTGITCSKDEVSVTLHGVKNQPGSAAIIFGALSEAAINIDMIVQNSSQDEKTNDITFTLHKTDLSAANEALAPHKNQVYNGISYDEDNAKVSIVGIGMKTTPGVAQKMFQIFADKGINILVVSTSDIKISVLIRSEYMELAMRSLHTAYNLDA